MDKKIAKNYAYNVAYQLLVIVAPLITAPYVSRVLHSDGIGVYSYTQTIATAFALVAGLGFSIYGQREVAYCQDDIEKRSTVFFEIVIYRTVMTAVVTAAYVIFSLAYKKYSVYLLPQTIMVLAVMFDVSWYFQGMENFRITVLRNVIVKLATIVLTFLLVKTERDLGIYIVIHSVSVFVSNLFYFFIIPRYVVKVALSQLHPLRHTRGTIEFFIPMIAVQIYSYLDKIMLGWYMSGMSESGYYEQARKITSMIVAVIIALNSVMMSRVSSLYAKNKKEDIIRYYARTFNIILMLLLPICTGLVLVSDNFVSWFFGADFQKAALLLKISALLIAFMCIGNFVGVQFLTPTGKQNQMTRAYILAASVNVALNAMLIPRLYSVGAMVASVIAEMISSLLQLWLLLRSSYRFNMIRTAWKYVLAAGVMAAFILCGHQIVHLSGIAATFVDVAVGGAVYIVSLYFAREENVLEATNVLVSRFQKKSI